MMPSLVPLLTAAFLLSLAGCGSRPVASGLPHDAGGLPVDAGGIGPTPPDGGVERDGGAEPGNRDGGARDGGPDSEQDGGPVVERGCSPDGGPGTCKLRLESNGGGRIVSTPAGIDCGTDCRTAEAAFPNGATVTLTAEGSPGHPFVGWRDDCWGSGPCTLVMNLERRVRATFAASEYTLVIDRRGEGVVSDDLGAIECGAICEATYPAHTIVTLTAPVEYPWASAFYGDCSGIGTASVIMDADLVCRVSFNLPAHLLTVSRTGSGNGRVVSDPQGIDCGSRCAGTFQAGAVLSLTALPDEGSVFQSWQGDCTGTGECIVVLDQPREVKAEFELQQ